MIDPNRRRYLLPMVLVAVLVAADGQASPPEYIVNEQPVPASVEDERTPLEEAYPVEVPLPSAFPELKKRLETAAPFWRDTQLLVHPRVYYFDRQRETSELILRRYTPHRRPTARTTRTARCC